MTKKKGGERGRVDKIVRRLLSKCDEPWFDCSLTIVPSYKGIAVGAPLLPVDVLVRLLKRDVHVAVDGLQLAFCVFLMGLSVLFCWSSLFVCFGLPCWEVDGQCLWVRI